MARTCAYCGKTKSLTREHLWPASLHKRLQTIRGDLQHSFWSKRLDKSVPSEPKIKDVCENCNNVALSELDAYICVLFDKYFATILEKGDKVIFRYDYDRLARWLLKLSYNSARAENAFDVFALEPLAKYIVMQEPEPQNYFRAFVQLQYPGRISKDDLANSDDSARTEIFYPVVNRAGHMLFSLSNGSRKILRAVHLCSYTFLIAFFKPEETGESPEAFVEVFLHYNKRTKLLSRNANRLKLICGEADAWQSIQAARSTSFAFDDGT